MLLLSFFFFLRVIIMKKLCLLILGMLPLFSCVKEEMKSSVSKINVGDQLPDFSIRMLDGSVVNSDTLKNKVALIVFFDTTCKDCRRELPKVEKVWQALGESPSFILLPISRGQSPDKVKSYWQSVSFDMPVYLDDHRLAYSLFAESVIPRFYLADRRGVVRWTGTETLEETADDLIGKINALR